MRLQITTNSTCSYYSLFCDLVGRPQGRSTTRGRSLRAPRAPDRQRRTRQGGGGKRKRQARLQIETRATIRRPNGRQEGPGIAEEVSEPARALSLADESVGVLACRPGGATTVFGKIIGEAFLWYRQRRGLGGSRGFALCAVPIPPPSPHTALAGIRAEDTRCSVPGRAAGRAAALLLLRVGAETGDARGLSGLWRSLLHHPLSLFCAAPPALRLLRAFWVAGAVRTCLVSYPAVSCARVDNDLGRNLGVNVSPKSIEEVSQLRCVRLCF